jgi:ABC-type polysaccharide/polyol phosphate transport system ATPase subunit
MKPILEIQHISKKFSINHEQQPYLSIRDSISNIFKFKKSTEDFWALKDLNFNIEQGDTVGIIGKNGAGKSTLLKILSKITPPSSGKIIGRGRIASLLEVGTGFHPELTGRENIFMNGSILGMRRKEILKNFDAIVDFSGVEKFIDTPLKHYSSGMQLRLAFAVAAFLENEILIIDEVLAVGDAEFQKKCMGKMEDVSKSGKTILFVSHNLVALNSLCRNSILLENGEVAMFSNTSKVIPNYIKHENLVSNDSGLKLDFYFDDDSNSWEVGSCLNIEVNWNSYPKITSDVSIDIACYTVDGIKIFAFQSERFNDFDFDLAKNKKLRFIIKNPGLVNNAIFFDLGIRNKGNGAYFQLFQKCFIVTPGSLFLPNYTREDVVIIPEIKYEYL